MSPANERLLALDWGHKRIGIAFADEVGVPIPLAAAVQASQKERLAQIGETIAARGVTALVVGYPLNMNGSVGPKAREVDAFVTVLEKRFGLPVHRADERLTSHSVEQSLCGGKKPTRQSGKIDSMAAALILGDFLAERALPLPEEFPLLPDPDYGRD